MLKVDWLTVILWKWMKLKFSQEICPIMSKYLSSYVRNYKLCSLCGGGGEYVSRVKISHVNQKTVMIGVFQQRF